jgi:hypothetical protein
MTPWPEGLFAEDFEEVRAIRRAQEAFGVTGNGRQSG